MSEESDWKQYDMLAMTVRHGTDTLLKINVFYYAVTGAMLSFYLSRPAPVPPMLRFSLALPFLMGIACAVICVRSGQSMAQAEADIEAIGARLGLQSWPNTTGLRDGLYASSVFFVLTAVGLALLMLLGGSVHEPGAALGGV